MYQISTEVIEQAPSITAITTQPEQAVAIELLARLKNAVKQIEEQRVALKKPHLDAGKAVDKEAAEFADKFQVHIDRIQPLLIKFDEQQRKAAEEQRKEAEEKARQEAAELKRLADEAAEKAIKDADEAASLAALALEGAGTEEEQLEALAASEQADKTKMAAQVQAGNIEAVTNMLVGAAVRNTFTGRSVGVAGATAKTAIEFYHELDNIALVPEQYLVDPEDRIKRSALPRPSQTRPAEIPGFRIAQRTALRTRI